MSVIVALRRFACSGIEVEQERLAKMAGVDLTGEVKEPGCTHKFDREKNEFCGKCGAVAWNIFNREDDFEISDLDDFFATLGLEVMQEGDTCYVGCYFSGKGEKLIKKLQETNDALLKHFKKDGDVHSGETYD